MVDGAHRSLALVTGAARRLGRDLSICLARMGYDLVLHCHDSWPEAERTREDILALGGRAEIVQADLTDPDQIARIFQQIDSLGGQLRILINSAAVMNAGKPATVSVDNFDAEMDLNLRAPFHCAQLAAARMDAGGLIINISDVGAAKAWTRYPVYSVSKAGLDSLTRILARSLAPAIRVNGIAPGLVYKSEGLSQKEWDDILAKIPLQRAAQSEEIMGALEFLIKNEYVTGQTILVDGGYSLV